MHFLHLVASGLLATLPIVHALPAVNPSSAASAFVSSVCTAPSKNFNPLELDVASIFCSAYLHVKTATISVTSTTVLAAQTSSAIHQTLILTNTETNYATATIPTTTSTTLPASTSLTTVVITPAPVTNILSITTTLAESVVLDTLPASLVTITNTDVIATTSTSTAYQTQTNVVESFEKRQAAPTQFASFAASIVSQACSCLVHTPTSTIKYTVTSTPAVLPGPIISTTATVSTTITDKVNVQQTFTDTIPGTTLVVKTQTTLPASLVSITQTATLPAVTTTSTITPSPVTITASTTTSTTAFATATTVRVETIDYVFQLVNGPNAGCFYDAGLQNGFIKEADSSGTCAGNCATTAGCVSYTTAYYIPGGGTACYLFSKPYNAAYLDCTDYGTYPNNYNDEVVYNLVNTIETVQ